MHPIRTALLFVLACALGLPGTAWPASSQGIFTAVSPDTLPQGVAGADAAKTAIAPVRSRYVTVHAAALFPAAAPDRANVATAAPLSFNLFDDVTVSVTPQATEAVGKDGATVLVGDNDTATGGQTRVANTGGTLYGIVRTSGRLLYEIAPTAGDVYVIREIDQSSYPNEKEKMPTEPSAPDATPDSGIAGTSGTAAAQADDGSTIDIMVLYTPSARTAAGGTAAMQALIALGISETNQGYANSGVIQRFRLVHTQEVSYVENTGSTGFDTALAALRGTTDGQMDEIHALRNLYGADIVSLLINNDNYCGLGYVMTSTSSNFSAYAFNVVHYSCATGYYSLAHECGHNQGAIHDRDHSVGDTPLYNYAYGYQQTAAPSPFRTIMAYDCTGGCTRVNYWSNPEVSYTGYPTGVLSTAALAADNRLTLNNTRVIAANWRQALRQAKNFAPTWLLLGQ